MAPPAHRRDVFPRPPYTDLPKEYPEQVRGRDIEKYDLPPILCRPKRANFNYSNFEKVLLLLFCVFSCSNAQFFCFLWDFP